MKTVFVEELRAKCQLADCYQDLRGKDVIGIVRQVYQNPKSAAAKIQLLRKLFDCPENVWQLLMQEQNHDQLWRLLQTMDWILKGTDFRPVGSVKIRGRRLLLPDENLHQVKTAEFVVATAHLIAFYSAKSEAAALDGLCKFMATIARPKPDVIQRIRQVEPGQDSREEYNSTRCELRASIFEKVDIVTMIMTAQWFNNAANKLLTIYGMGGGGDPDAAPISQGIFVQDWERQIVRVAESHVFGNYDQVMGRPLPDVLAYIELKNDELRRKAAASRK
ncbi:hypothetical protein [Dyadobacter sp.]|uniref:hypothetical protein n=1 Tax=Dyadobacter sp. TaxID=1914288 RepID=UPI003F71ADF4